MQGGRGFHTGPPHGLQLGFGCKVIHDLLMQLDSSHQCAFTCIPDEGLAVKITERLECMYVFQPLEQDGKPLWVTSTWNCGILILAPGLDTSSGQLDIGQLKAHFGLYM